MEQQELEILLKDLQAFPKECEWAEFKVNNSKPLEIGEYLSALSNGACYHHKPFGYLVYGIENNTHRLVGTTFFPSNEKIGNQELENWLATQLDPRVDFRIFEFNYNDLHFVIFRVDSAHFTPVKFQNKSFIRIGSYKKPLSEHTERERKIWDNTNKIPFEKKTSPTRVSEDEILKIIDYPSFFDMLELPLPHNINGIIGKLCEEKIIVSTEGGLYSVTNLGAILFAKRISDFETIARKSVRVIIYKGNDKTETKKEQLGTRGYAVGFAGLIQFIIDQLPTNEVIESALRKEVPVYPPLAIRELVANALIHQDFSIGGTSPMVEIFNNRIEITNPGKPLIDPLRFIDHSPESRNEILAGFMRRLNVCEERGSGIDKVVYQCELFQLPAPEFVAGDNYTRIILYSPKLLRDMDKQDKIRACYLHASLKCVSGDTMTNTSLRERFRIEEHNYAIASRIISDTKEAGLIKDYDPTNKSKPQAKYLPFWG